MNPRRQGFWQALLGMGADQPDAQPEEMAQATPPLRDRIQDDPTARAYGEQQKSTPVGQSPSQRGTTEDLESQGASSRLALADQMRAQQGPQPPSHLDQLQAQYDQLNPKSQPMTLKQKLLRGALGAGVGLLAGPQGMQRIEQERNFQQNQQREKSQNLLSQIEAERRMQEQENLATQRMTLQEQMQQEREEAAAARQAPTTVDTDTGKLQWNPRTRNWDPITIGGQPAMSPAAAKEKTPMQLMQERTPVADSLGLAGVERQHFLATGQMPAALDKPKGETGTWSIQPGTDGKNVLFNSKTGETRAAPEGIAPKQGQLTPATQGILQTTAPVKDQVQQLLQSLDSYIAQKPGNDKNRLTVDRAKYAMGMESPEGSIADQISKLELDRVMAGARVLKGSSRAYQALELAMKHAPNAWVDQTGLMRQKLQNILENLNDVEKDAVRYGTKGQTAQDVAGSMPRGSMPPKAPTAKLKDRVSGRVLVEGQDF